MSLQLYRGKIAIIGNSRLTLGCANKIQEFGFKIVCICTEQPALIHWASLNNIPCLKKAQQLLDYSYEYLFSIMNDVYLDDALISSATELSINYHNSLLPKYAGLNATSWAILNNEKEHGITWHVIDEVIDQGDILIQNNFPIEKSDTALTLDLKCQTQAIESINTLLNNIITKKFSRQPQNSSDRTYYSARDIPENCGVIDWQQSVKDIEALFKATYFAKHINPFCTIKIATQTTYCTPTNMTFHQSTPDCQPGTIINISKQHVDICCKDGYIRIISAQTSTGKELCPSKILSYLNAQKRQQLPVANNTHIKEYKNARYGERKKKLLLKKMLATNSPEYFKNNTTNEPDYKSIEIHTSNSTRDLFLIYYLLIRANNYNEIYTAIDQKSDRNPLLAEHTPISIELNPEATIGQLLELFETSIDDKHSLKRYTLDLIKQSNETLETYREPDVLIVKNNNPKNEHSNSLIKITILKRKILISYNNNRLNEQGRTLFHFLPTYIEKAKILAKKHKLLKEICLENPNNIEKNNQDSKNINILDRLKDITQRNKNSTALFTNTISITYGELDTITNNLAQQIEKSTSNDKVGILIENKFIAVISILSTSKAGKIYVPINNDETDSRINDILSDAKIDLLIHDQNNQKIKTNTIEIKNVMRYLSHTNETPYNPKSIPNKKVSCILYTSGSTGKPKGTFITNTAICNLAINQNYIHITNKDIIFQLSNYAFDASTFEIWGALLNGAKLFCPEKYSMISANKLLIDTKTHNPTIMWLTKSVFDLYVKNNIDIFSNLKYLITGGEALSPNTINLLIKKPKLLRPTYFVNGYGPTEATTFTCTYLIESELDPSERVPIGKPIHGAKITLLDKYNMMAPNGMLGTICISGKGLSCGYTDKKFNSDFISINNERHYYTHDIAFVNENNDCVFVAREDSQIKLRGLRIDLEFIKFSAEEIPDVEQAIPTIKTTNKKELQLYVKLKPESNLSTHSIREELKKHLSTYQLPQKIHLLSHLPLNKNGKLYYKKLTDYIIIDCQSNSSQPIEKLSEIDKIWNTVLGKESLSPPLHNEDFYDAGGDSLLTAELFLKINKKFGAVVPFHDFINNPTIDSLKKLIAKEKVDSELHFTEPSLEENLTITSAQKFDYNNIKTILLTGSTGFLGAHILDELLSNTEMTIFCAVRSNNIEKAIERQSLIQKQYGLNPIPENRTRFISVDFNKENLGISRKLYNSLTQEIDCIIHTAAHINHLYNYEKLKKENTDATASLLELAFSKKPKLFTYISTVSAIADMKNGQYAEDFPQTTPTSTEIPDGYSQSKWTSEKLLTQAKQRGLPVNIIRYSWLTGSTSNGAINPTNNHLLNFMKGCTQLGYIPDVNLEFNFTPIDFAASVLIDMLFKNNIVNKVINFISPHNISLNMIATWLNTLGHPVETISLAAWRHQLCNLDKENALFPLLPLYISDGKLNRLDKHIIRSQIKHQNLSIQLDKLNITYPLVDFHLMKKYVAYLEKIHF